MRAIGRRAQAAYGGAKVVAVRRHRVVGPTERNHAMAITTLTVNGVVVETTDASLVLTILQGASGPSPVVPAQPLKEAAQGQRRTATKAKSAKSTKAKAPKVAPAQDLLTDVRRLKAEGKFDAARKACPASWKQELAAIDKAEQRAASAQEAPKEPAQEKQRAARKTKAKTTKAKAKSVPTGTDEAPVKRTATPRDEELIVWKNGMESKVNDLLAGGDGDEIAMAYCELTEMVDALDRAADADPSKAGFLIAKAAFVADLVQRLDEFDGAMAPVRW